MTFDTPNNDTAAAELAAFPAHRELGQSLVHYEQIGDAASHPVVAVSAHRHSSESSSIYIEALGYGETARCAIRLSPEMARQTIAQLCEALAAIGQGIAP